MTTRSLILGLSLVACGGANGPRHVMPETRLATGTAASAPAIACREARAYDLLRGCHEPQWGVPVSLEHRNEMGESFRLVGAAFALDGELVFDTNDPRVLRRKSFPIFTTNVRTGEHQLHALLVYRGHGYGVFAYLSGYRFQATGAHVFSAGAGDVRLRSIGFEQSDVPLERRPAIRFQAW